jgi:hypothetical protein
LAKLNKNFLNIDPPVFKIGKKVSEINLLKKVKKKEEFVAD